MESSDLQLLLQQLSQELINLRLKVIVLERQLREANDGADKTNEG